MLSWPGLASQLDNTVIDLNKILICIGVIIIIIILLLVLELTESIKFWVQF